MRVIKWPTLIPSAATFCYVQLCLRGFMQKEVMASVICAGCKWQGRRKTGQIVVCPICGSIATFKIK
jgi:hypothetical protein